ncbi:hypothetical protein Goshw_003878 [Gossypium schwendimanii]|uniref:Aminotransferase-like plant mobile domain-containing protein n=1 Tax=Gossypium schwendimanii TaxID=34291 RepID=A0A7J9KQE2_GOSSC|nr:hypothetical protein [Gossypium schwendimanii]
MAASLIRFDDKHIFVAQAAMADDCVLEGFIHNMGKPPIPQIHGYSQEVGFLHTSRIVGASKLDPTLISALVERWRPETQRPKTHTFHLPCVKCTITLEDIMLQLELSVDGRVVTGSMIVPGKFDLCKAMLGKVLDKFDGGQISINSLEDNFEELLEDPTEEVATISSGLQSMRKTKLEICRLIHVTLGAVSSHGTQYDVNRWNHKPSYMGLFEELEDFRLLLDQCSEAEFEWMSYANTVIISCIPPEVFANREMWDAKVEAVDFATIARHKEATVGGHVNSVKGAMTTPQQQCRRGYGHMMGSSSTSTEEALPFSMQYQGTYFRAMASHVFFTSHADVDADLDAWLDSSACIAPNEDIDTDTHAVVDANFDVGDNTDVPGIRGTLWFHVDYGTNTICITILLG